MTEDFVTWCLFVFYQVFRPVFPALAAGQADWSRVDQPSHTEVYPISEQPFANSGLTSLLDLSNERDQWLKRLHDTERAAYERGKADGWREGYADCVRDEDESWASFARKIYPVLPQAAGHSFNEMNHRRYGDGGRIMAGAVREGDYMGGPVSWDE